VLSLASLPPAWLGPGFSQGTAGTRLRFEVVVGLACGLKWIWMLSVCGGETLAGTTAAARTMVRASVVCTAASIGDPGAGVEGLGGDNVIVCHFL
jgi:hypothetical protein